jgi:hypothetical protein
MNRDIIVSESSANGSNLPREAVSESRPVAPAHEEAIVGLEPPTYVALLHLSLVVLGVDDPYARCGNRQMIDVAARTRNFAIMKKNRAIADEFRETGRQAPLTFRASQPRRRRLRIIRDELHNSRQSPPPALDLLTTARPSPFVLFTSGRPGYSRRQRRRCVGMWVDGGARVHSGIRIRVEGILRLAGVGPTSQARRRTRCRVPPGLRTRRKRVRAFRTRPRVTQTDGSCRHGTIVRSRRRSTATARSVSIESIARRHYRCPNAEERFDERRRGCTRA